MFLVFYLRLGVFVSVENPKPKRVHWEVKPDKSEEEIVDFVWDLGTDETNTNLGLSVSDFFWFS